MIGRVDELGSEIAHQFFVFGIASSHSHIGHHKSIYFVGSEVEIIRKTL
jgi:hypothetical protein